MTSPRLTNPSAWSPGLCLLVGLAACGGTSREAERLVRIYEPRREVAQDRVSSVVFVPGIMGSELWSPRDGHIVWGHFWRDDGPPEHALTELALPLAVDQPVTELTDEVVPGGQLLEVRLGDGELGPIRARGYPGIFEGIVEALVQEDAHHAPSALSFDEIETGRNPIVGFGYDWRHDLTAEALRLHAVLRVAAAARRQETGESRVDVVSHSMGTQLLRWYLRYGPTLLPEEGPLPEVTWAGARLVERAILLGAPNLGEAHAFEVLLEGISVSPVLPSYPPAVVGTFPAAYQLMPRMADGRVVWADDGTPVDLYDVDVWERLGWGLFGESQDEALQALLPDARDRDARLAAVRRHVARCLRQAQRFHEALDRPAPPPPELSVHLFVGDLQGTRSVLEVERETGALRWRDEEAGDGTVTRASALGERRSAPGSPPTIHPDSVHFVRSDHLDMTADPQVLDHILYLLLEAPSPATDPG